MTSTPQWTVFGSPRDQPVHVVPPSSETSTPAAYVAAYIRPGRAGSVANAVTGTIGDTTRHPVSARSMIPVSVATTSIVRSAASAAYAAVPVASGPDRSVHVTPPSVEAKKPLSWRRQACAGSAGSIATASGRENSTGGIPPSQRLHVASRRRRTGRGPRTRRRWRPPARWRS